MVLAEKQTDQWNKIESPEINPHVCGQVIFPIQAKNIQYKGKKVSSTNGAGTIAKTHAKE